MEKLRQSVRTAFYIRYIYTYVIANVETGSKMVYYKQHRSSPWMNRFANTETWLNAQEIEQLNSDNIECPNTKWVFVKFSNVQVKVVLDRQPMLGNSLLLDWLRNLARGQASSMVVLDTFYDNLCLWRCTAVYQGARPDRSTQAARGLAQSFLKHPHILKTSLDELDEVKRFLNQRKRVAEWLGIRVYEPEPQENGETVWNLRKNPSDRLQNIITIGIYEGHAFLIKGIKKLARLYACADCQARFTQACSLKNIPKHV